MWFFSSEEIIGAIFGGRGRGEELSYYISLFALAARKLRDECDTWLIELRTLYGLHIYYYVLDPDVHVLS